MLAQSVLAMHASNSRSSYSIPTKHPISDAHTRTRVQRQIRIEHSEPSCSSAHRHRNRHPSARTHACTQHAHLHDLRPQQALEGCLRAKRLLRPTNVGLCPTILLLIAFLASLPFSSPRIGFPLGQCIPTRLYADDGFGVLCSRACVGPRQRCKFA